MLIFTSKYVYLSNLPVLLPYIIPEGVMKLNVYKQPERVNVADSNTVQ